MAETVLRPAPGRRSRWVVDIALEMGRHGVLPFFVDTWREYGDLCRLEIGSRSMFLAVHPEHVRHIAVTGRDRYDKRASYDVVRRLLLGDGLITSTGDLWRRQRRWMAPFFTPRAVEQYAPLITAEGWRLIERWQALAQAGRPVEMVDEMMAVTAAIILRSVFSMAPGAELHRIKNDVETMIGFTALFQMRPFQPPLWVPTGRNRGYRAARRRVDAFINGLIAARRPQPEVGWPDDLLSKLMRARDESTGAGMSEQLLRDEAVTLFFAGHETTARTLTFAWFALSQNPGVLARLQAEVDRQLGDREPTPADLAAMPYALQVIKETLRLHPPAPMYVRDAVTDDILDGVRIPAGSRVLLLPYCTHRHPDFWPDAESFEPARWEAEAESRRHPYAYHPFAAGPRVCLGNSFSLFESHLLLVMLARRFSASMKPGHDPKIDMAGTLVARNGIPLQISLRA